MKQHCQTPFVGQEVCDWDQSVQYTLGLRPQTMADSDFEKDPLCSNFRFLLECSIRTVRLPVFYFSFLMKRRNKKMTFTKQQSSVGQCTKRVSCKKTQTARAQMLSPYSKEQSKTTMTSCANTSITELLLRPTDGRRGPCRIIEVHGCLPPWEVREDRADFLQSNLV